MGLFNASLLAIRPCSKRARITCRAVNVSDSRLRGRCWKSRRFSILDEATSALDPESEAVILANLKSISRGRTTIIVTYRLSFVRDADQIFVLDDGVVTMVGQHSHLVNSSSTYRKLWNQQAVSFR